jgi:hypothetical protein
MPLPHPLPEFDVRLLQTGPYRLPRHYLGSTSGLFRLRQVRLSETLCADDTGAYFLSREDLEKDTPLLFRPAAGRLWA